MFSFVKFIFTQDYYWEIAYVVLHGGTEFAEFLKILKTDTDSMINGLPCNTLKSKGGRHLKYSMANWKKIIDLNLIYLGWSIRVKLLWGDSKAREKVRSKSEIGTRVQGTWRNRHPGSFLIPEQFLRFHSSSSTPPNSFFQSKPDSMNRIAEINFASGPP